MKKGGKNIIKRLGGCSKVGEVGTLSSCGNLDQRANEVACFNLASLLVKKTVDLAASAKACPQKDDDQNPLQFLYAAPYIFYLYCL